MLVTSAELAEGVLVGARVGGIAGAVGQPGQVKLHLARIAEISHST